MTSHPFMEEWINIPIFQGSFGRSGHGVVGFATIEEIDHDSPTGLMFSCCAI